MNALKAVSKTDDQLVVENYIVLFGGRDLEGAVNDNHNPDGSVGEFFTKSTDLRSAYTNTGRLYVDWEHGFADDDEPNADEPLGFVDWTTAKADDTGVRVQRILDRRAAFVRMIEPLIDEGMIGTSSEAVPQKVRKADTGEILRWPLRRDTLTVTPMEPRMLSENAMQAVKALADKVPTLRSMVLDDEISHPPTTTTSVSTITMDDLTLGTDGGTNVTYTVDYQQLAGAILHRMGQPVEATPPAAGIDDVEDVHEDGDAESSAPAVEPETAPEPEDARFAEVLGEFVETISGQIREAIES